MRKITLVLIAVFTLFSFYNANAVNLHKKDTTKEGILSKGKLIFDVYYGFPNMWASYKFQKFYFHGDENYGTLYYAGPIGLRTEIMISHRIGFGLDLSYMNSWLQWFTDGNVYSSSSGMYADSSFKVSITRIGVVPRFYYHFVNHRRYDMYLSAAMGYRSKKLTTTSNAPNWEPKQMIITPIALRFCMGGRIFIGNNFAFNFEAGIGGAFLTVGLTMKI